MIAKSRKIKILAGSPTIDCLEWDEHTLVSAFDSRVLRFLGRDISVSNASQTTNSFSFPAWRQVIFDHDDIATNTSTTALQSTHCQSKDKDNGAATDRLDFLEHSLAVIDDLQSSQIQAPAEPLMDNTTLTSFTTSTFSTNDTSFATTSDDYSSAIPTTEPTFPPPAFPSPITDLSRVPSAAHIRCIQPQTMTLNFVAGIISVAGARTVALRRRKGAAMDLIELLVGDDTRAGFGVSFWFPTTAAAAAATAATAAGRTATAAATTTAAAPSNKARARQLQRRRLEALRPGDVVLLTCVALSEFQGAVYGQSLNRRTTRNCTTVALVGGEGPGVWAAKVARVRAWADRFVAGATRDEKKRAFASGVEGGDGRHRGRKRMVTQGELLPPDTQ